MEPEVVEVDVDVDLWFTNIMQREDTNNTIGFREIYMQLYNSTTTTSESASMADFLNAWLKLKKTETIVANAIIDTCVAFAIYYKLKDTINETQKNKLIHSMRTSWSIFTEIPLDPDSVLEVPVL
jgi:hypothetical protein